MSEPLLVSEWLRPEEAAPRLASQWLRARFPEGVIATHQSCGDDTAVIRRESLRAVAQALRDEPDLAFNVLMDLTAVDGLKLGAASRFEAVYHLYSLEHNRRLRLKVPVEARDPSVDSLADLWPSANWFEREVWDMFGIRFHGHPHLKRLLMYEEFSGHPLRKDYPVNQRQPLLGPVN